MKEMDTDAVLDAFGKNERTQKVFWTFSAAFARLVLAHVVDPGTAENVVEVLAGLCRETGRRPCRFSFFTCFFYKIARFAMIACDPLAELPGSSAKANRIPERSLNRPGHVLSARVT